MKKIDLTPEKIAEICELYEDKSLTMKQLELLLGMNKTTIRKIALEHGCATREPAKVGNVGTKKSTRESKVTCKCPNCHRKFEKVAFAKFCCFCGSDIRSKTQILAEDLEELTALVEYIPSQYRDKFRDTVLAAASELAKL